MRIRRGPSFYPFVNDYERSFTIAKSEKTDLTSEVVFVIVWRVVEPSRYFSSIKSLFLRFSVGSSPRGDQQGGDHGLIITQFHSQRVG